MYYRLHSPPAMQGLGAEERANPLPPGHYWIDVFGDNRAKMDAWVQAMSPTVKVESTTESAGQSWYITQAITDWFGVSDPTADASTASTRYTFRTTGYLPWDGTTFGFPEIIVDPPPGTSPPAIPGQASSPGSKSAAATSAAAASGMSTTVVAVAAGAVLVGAVAFAVMHRHKAA